LGKHSAHGDTQRRRVGALHWEETVNNETTTTVAGNLTAVPELRFTPTTGRAVATFTVASTTRVLDTSSGEWRDGGTLFMRCTAWRQMAQNAVESLRKGDRVVVTGRLQQRTYELHDGQKRSTIELVADEVSISLRNAIIRAVPSRDRMDAGQTLPPMSEQVGRELPREDGMTPQQPREHSRPWTRVDAAGRARTNRE